MVVRGEMSTTSARKAVCWAFRPPSDGSRAASYSRSKQASTGVEQHLNGWSSPRRPVSQDVDDTGAGTGWQKRIALAA
jgi:hypothetical protein